jgi:signal transduction histidine kinase
MTSTQSPQGLTQPDTRDVGLLFLANFVHQVVNPLNGVIGTLDNITDGTYKGEVVAQKVNASRAQLEQCVTLIRNLAYLSDFFFEVSGKDALRPARETATSILPQVVIEAVQFFQIAAEKRFMRLELVDSITQYKLLVRPELLRQIFINMFDNWVKYGLGDQTIRVLTNVNSKHDLVIEIIGKSVGFDNSDAGKLFELGFRSRQARDKVAQGSGIGLYICKQIVERALSGHLSAEHRTRTNESVFRIAIPQAKWQL